jgi:hypothetical protein
VLALSVTDFNCCLAQANEKGFPTSQLFVLELKNTSLQSSVSDAPPSLTVGIFRISARLKSISL